MNNVSNIADQKIKKTSGKYNLMYKEGKTDDIIAVILHADKRSASFTKNFASSLIGGDIKDTCRKIWNFVKTNVEYREDPFGVQNIKSPSEVWQTKVADCKSYSIFIGSILQNIGIPYTFRFVAFKGRDRVTHVYPIVPLSNGRHITIDCVMNAFDKEKPYTGKRDYQLKKKIL